MRLVQECLRIVWEASYDLAHPNDRKTTLKFWVVENPYTGMLKDFLGKPAFVYSPEEFGDDFTKRTALWGKFNEPAKPLFKRQLPMGNSVKDKFTPMNVRDHEERMALRSIASPFFTKAFFEANP